MLIIILTFIRMLNIQVDETAASGSIDFLTLSDLLDSDSDIDEAPAYSQISFIMLPPLRKTRYCKVNPR